MPENTQFFTKGGYYLKQKQVDIVFPLFDFVIFHYQTDTPTNIGTIELINLKGQLIKQFTIEGSKGNLRFETETLPTGIYFYRLVIGKQTSNTQKLIISK